MRDLAAAVGALTIVAGLISLWMGYGAYGFGVVAVGGLIVWGTIRARP